MSQATLAVAVADNQARIKVNGRATFQCTENLKDFCNNILDKKTISISVEMENCTGMDSTFMGMMAQISLKARKQDSVITINNINDDNKKNIFSLGLKNMFNFTSSEEQESSWENIEPKNADQETQRQNIIDAHQTLIDVHEDNRKEFQDIVNFLNLEKEMDQEKSD